MEYSRCSGYLGPARLAEKETPGVAAVQTQQHHTTGNPSIFICIKQKGVRLHIQGRQAAKL